MNCRRSPALLPAPTAAKSTLTDSKAARSRPKPTSSKSASIKIRFPPNTIASATAASRSSPSPARRNFQGSVGGFGTDSALSTANPFLAGAAQSYYQYSYSGNISGPITKTSSYFFNAFTITRQNQSIVDALNPATLSNFSEAFPTPMNYFNLTPRVDFQISKNNFISIRDQYARYSGARQRSGRAQPPRASHRRRELEQ